MLFRGNIDIKNNGFIVVSCFLRMRFTMFTLLLTISITFFAKSKITFRAVYAVAKNLNGIADNVSAIGSQYQCYRFAMSVLLVCNLNAIGTLSQCYCIPKAPLLQIGENTDGCR